MVRPRITKNVCFEPKITYFKPRAVPLSKLKEIEITIDELETLRLSNLEKLDQTSAAESMGVHQSTFQRTLTRAREKMTDALVHGKAIKIHGGEYKMPKGDRTGPQGKGPKTGRGLGLCSGNKVSGRENETAPRQGMARGPQDETGKGLGRGRRRRLSE